MGSAMNVYRALVPVALGLLACGNVSAPNGGGAGAGGEAGAAGEACDADGDGRESEACGGDDCHDERRDVYPGAPDVFDGDDRRL